MEQVNVDRLLSVRTPANEEPITAVLELEPWRSSRIIARELGLSHPRALEAHISFQTVALYECRFANAYDISTLRISTSYKTSCGQTKHVLRVRVCSMPTIITFDTELILMLRRQRLGWNGWDHCLGPLSSARQAGYSAMS
jgi:hypothetical protein